MQGVVMRKKMTLKRYICHNCGYIGFPLSKSTNCPKCGAPYMVPGETVKRKKPMEEQEIDPIRTKKSHKRYWIALWIMSLVIALAVAIYLFVVLKPSQSIFYTKAKMKLPSEKIDLGKKAKKGGEILTFQKWDYEFDGTYSDTRFLRPEPGVYIIWCDSGNIRTFLDVGESDNVLDRINNHERKDCWFQNCQGIIQHSVVYIADQKERRDLVDRIKSAEQMACGEKGFFTQ